MRRDIPPYDGLTRLVLADRIARYSWSVGDHTYGHPKILEEAGGPLAIGRFCSIAAVTIVLGNHISSHASTYPFDSFRPYWPKMTDASCHRAKGVTIGSDVWLAEGAMLMPGSDVGHGAIVGAGSVVRGAVPPFAIVSGNPATLVRHRFDPATIARLLRTAWWDRTDEAINELVPLLVSSDLEALLSALEAGMTPEPAERAAPAPVPPVTPIPMPGPAPVAEPVFVRTPVLAATAQGAPGAGSGQEPPHDAVETAIAVQTLPRPGPEDEDAAPPPRRSAWSILAGR